MKPVPYLRFIHDLYKPSSSDLDPQPFKRFQLLPIGQYRVWYIKVAHGNLTVT